MKVFEFYEWPHSTRFNFRTTVIEEAVGILIAPVPPKISREDLKSSAEAKSWVTSLVALCSLSPSNPNLFHMLSKSLYPSSVYIHTHPSRLCCDYKICIGDVVECWSSGAETECCGGVSNACQVMRGESEMHRIPHDWIYDVNPARGTQRNSAFCALNNCLWI